MQIPATNASHASQQALPLTKAHPSLPGGAQLPTNPSQAAAPGSGPQVGSNGGLSPSERLDRYAEHMMARLDAFEQAHAGSGLDLSSVRRSFENHIAGLQDAMSQDGLAGPDLAAGIQDAVHMVRDGVRDAMGMQPMTSAQSATSAGGQVVEAGAEQTNLDIDHSLERLDAMEEHIRGRMDNYLANLAPEAHGQFHEASSRLDHSFGRLRDALSTGQMSLEDVRRSIENIMGDLRDDLAPPTTSSMTMGDGGQGPATPVGPAAGAQDAVSVNQPESTPAAQAAPVASATPAAPATPAWQQFLSSLDQQQSQSLTQIWQAQPRVQALLMGLNQDARQARGMDMATYSPSAQLQAINPEGFGDRVDLAI